MKTIYEKSYANESLAGKAAEKEFGKGWKKSHIATIVGTRWVITEKAPKNIDIHTLTACPKCGDEDGLYFGHAPEGIVIDEDKHAGCHTCGWNHTTKSKEPKLRMSTRLNNARKCYTTVMAYSGNLSADNSDEVAALLRGLAPSQVCEIADLAKKLPIGSHDAKYAGLNVGQRRMNAGNVIRGVHRAGVITTEEIQAVIAKFTV